MKSPALSLLLVSCLNLSSALADFPTHSAADRVLFTEGDFNSRSSSLQNAETTDGPVGIAIDPATGKLFVSSQFEHRILRFADVASLVSGAAAEAVIGQSDLIGQTDPGTTAARLDGPMGLAIDANGDLWVADALNNRVLRFPDAATVVNGSATADLVLGQDNTTTGTAGTAADRMDEPTGVFVDAAGNVWVADTGNHRVLKFNAGTLTTGVDANVVLGWPDFATPSDGLSANRFFKPVGVFVDGSDRLWVAEETNSRVLRFDGAVSIANNASAVQVLGQPDFSNNSEATSATGMRYPSALFVDGDGALYVSDSSNDRLLIFHDAANKTVNKSADRVLGTANFTTTNPGATATSQSLSRPQGIAMDPEGNLWVVDGNRVLRYTPAPDVPADVINPTLTITKSPVKKTSRLSVKISGIASDAGGVKEVRYRVGKGGLLKAAGTTSWGFKAKLLKGKSTTIQIYAEDFAGNRSATTTLRVKNTKK